MKIKWRHVLSWSLIAVFPLLFTNCLCFSKLGYSGLITTNVTVPAGVSSTIARLELTNGLTIPPTGIKIRVQVDSFGAALPTGLTFRAVHESGGSDVSSEDFGFPVDGKGKGKGTFLASGVALGAGDALRLELLPSGSALAPSDIKLKVRFKI